MTSDVRHPREQLKKIAENNKPAYVKHLFDSIAGRYDRMNWIMTGGLLALWHRALIRETGLETGDRALDVCCGTGDLTFLQARRVKSTGAVVGLDFSPNMLAIAEAREEKNIKKRSVSPGIVKWVQGDALNLPFIDGTDSTGFQSVTMGFALRNVGDIKQALSEMARVARTDGRIICLEVSRPDNALLRWGFNQYFFNFVPIIGRFAESRIPDHSPLKKLRPYTYLPYSLDHLPAPNEIIEIMNEVGLANARRIPLTGGIVSLYVGNKR